MNIDKTSEVGLDFYRNGWSCLLGEEVKSTEFRLLFDFHLIWLSDVPVYAFGNTSGDRDGIRPLRGKSFRPFAEVIDEDCNTGVALLRLRKRSWQT